MNDPIADMLTRLRNAQAIKKKKVLLPHSKQKLSLAKQLVSSGWLLDVKEKECQGHPGLELKIKYRANGNPHIREVTRISKPGRRVYVSHDKIPVIYDYYGDVVLSTSKGLLMGKEARRQSLGGEVICSLF